MQKKLKCKKAETSMSMGSKVICTQTECIGELSSDQKAGATNQEHNVDEGQKPTTRSFMKFGEDGSCSDEECIGKT